MNKKLDKRRLCEDGIHCVDSDAQCQIDEVSESHGTNCHFCGARIKDND